MIQEAKQPGSSLRCAAARNKLNVLKNLLPDAQIVFLRAEIGRCIPFHCIDDVESEGTPDVRPTTCVRQCKQLQGVQKPKHGRCARNLRRGGIVRACHSRTWSRHAITQDKHVRSGGAALFQAFPLCDTVCACFTCISRENMFSSSTHE
jgi:hypothetical protein